MNGHIVGNRGPAGLSERARRLQRVDAMPEGFNADRPKAVASSNAGPGHACRILAVMVFSRLRMLLRGSCGVAPGRSTNQERISMSMRVSGGSASNDELPAGTPAPSWLRCVAHNPRWVALVFVAAELVVLMFVALGLSPGGLWPLIWGLLAATGVLLSVRWETRRGVRMVRRWEGEQH
jgi:hypothetical protein